MKSKTYNVVRFALEVAKYLIGAILGYLEGSTQTISTLMCNVI